MSLNIDLELHYRDGTVEVRSNQSYWQVMKGPIKQAQTNMRPMSIKILSPLSTILNLKELNDFTHGLKRRLCVHRPRGNLTYVSH